MTEIDLVEKLRAMREHGRQRGQVDVMTMLFGLVFHEEIGSNGRSIAKAFNMQHSENVNGTVIQNGRKLAEFANPNDAVVRKWRG